MLGALVALSVLAAAPDAGASPDVDAPLEGFRAQIDCKSGSKDDLRAWCPAAKTKGATFQAPEKDAMYLGVVAQALPGKQRQAISKRVELGYLWLSGDRLWIGNSRPRTDDETAAHALIIGNVRLALEGKTKSIAIEGGVKEMPADQKKFGLQLRLEPNGPAAFSGMYPGHVWKTADAYVVLLKVGNDQMVAVFPIVPVVAK